MGFCNLLHRKERFLHDLNIFKVYNTVHLLEDDVTVVELLFRKNWRVWMEVFEDCLTVFNLSQFHVRTEDVADHVVDDGADGNDSVWV